MTNLDKLLDEVDPCGYMLDLYFRPEQFKLEANDNLCPIDIISDDLKSAHANYSNACQAAMKNMSSSSLTKNKVCEAEFDGFMCWPEGLPGSIVESACPAGFGEGGARGFRFCLSNGTWLTEETSEKNLVWSNIKQCNPIKEIVIKDDEVAVEISKSKTVVETFITVGCVSSICFLVLSLILLVCFRKLRYVPICLHMNLMFSYILWCLSSLIINKLMEMDIDGYRSRLVGCCAAQTIRNYTHISNYFWLLAEGIHLQILIKLPMNQSSVSNKYLPFYMIFGWVGPLIPVGIWMGFSLKYDTIEYCWYTDGQDYAMWCINRLVVIPILMNFILFANILKTIVCKLKAQTIKKTDKRLTLAKSTLILYLLLGPYHLVFIVLNEKVMQRTYFYYQIFVAFELIFRAFQGSLVAIFYCFLNNEVQKQVVRFLEKLQLIERLCSKMNIEKQKKKKRSEKPKLANCLVDNNPQKNDNFTSTRPLFVSDSDRPTNSRNDLI